jgi:serine/threonine protein kinase
MSKFEWESEPSKQAEWAAAKAALAPDGILKSDGIKLRRKDSNLSHSFITVGGKILAMAGEGVYLGEGAEGVVKLAEDEQGRLYALKIRVESAFYRKNMGGTLITDEGNIAHDIGKALPQTSRTSKGEHKYYVPYLYVGTPLETYLSNNKELDDDQFYDLFIKVFFAFDALHTGKNSKTQTQYTQGDPHFNNIMVNEKTGEVNLIDFGLARYRNKLNYSRLTRSLRGGTVFKDAVNFLRGEKGSFEFTEARTFVARCPIFYWSTSGRSPKFLELLDNLGDWSDGDAPSPYIDRTKHPFQLAAKQLTLLRFKLDTFDIYNQPCSDSDLEEILRLNQIGEEIQHVYGAMAQFSKTSEDLDADPVQLSSIKEALMSFETHYKHFLIAYAQNNEKGMSQYAEAFENSYQDLCKHPIVLTHEKILRPLLDSIDESGPRHQRVSPEKNTKAITQKYRQVMSEKGDVSTSEPSSEEKDSKNPRGTSQL